MKAVTESYCVMFEVKVNPSDMPEIDRRQECARQVYNTCLGQCQKHWRQIRSIPEWRSALKELQALNRKTELSSDEKSRQKILRQQLKAIEQAEGFSECWRTGWLLHKCARKNWTLAASNAHDFGA